MIPPAKAGTHNHDAVVLATLTDMTNPSPWRATVLTLFPEMFPGPLGVSLAGKALASGLWQLEARDIRASATDKPPQR